MTDAEPAELPRIVSTAGRTNHLVNALQVPIDAAFECGCVSSTRSPRLSAIRGAASGLAASESPVNEAPQRYLKQGWPPPPGRSAST
jgi:hypothetical protein